MRRRQPPVLAGCAALVAAGAVAQERGEEVARLELVDVVGATPVAGTEFPAALLPYELQSADDAALARAQAFDLTDYLGRHFAGVTVNAAQNNPLQPDLQFRGFTATPLLGGAQGLSVYLDGVRVNEVFGDTVNWDLVPTAAIERVDLLAGANPVFGLNTLGGAISIRSKTGFGAPGTRLAFDGGAFGRSVAGAEHAGHAGAWGWYLMGQRFDEDGWRDASPSRADTAYGTLSWRGDAASVDLHLGHGESRLTGNGPAPVELLDERWQAVFTAPDRTGNRMDLASAEAEFELSPHARLSASVFRREVDTQSYNGDATDADECEADDDLLCDDDGEPLRDQYGALVPARYDAINHISRRRQRSDGGTLQFSTDAPLFGRDNHFALGFDLHRGRLDFASRVEAAILGEDRRTSSGSGVFFPDQALAVHSHTRSHGLYATDTVAVTGRLALTLSARANRTRTTIADRSGAHPDLDGRHAFSRVNPAAGFTWRWSEALSAYGGYGESTRAPTPVELTCADADAPCRLPNQFLSDPPLRQVVAKSWEAGLRGARGAGADRLDWRVGVFRTTSTDDIIFQSTGGTQSNEGYFANVGDTRRQGLQAGVSGTSFDRRLDWHANWTWLDATFCHAFRENSAHHPDAGDDGLIEVRRGARIPGLPRHALKVGADWSLARTFAIGAEVVAQSAQYLRGDEANRLAPVGGHAVANLHARWQATPWLDVVARVDNLFDRRYASFGTLGEPDEVLPRFDDPRFLGPAPPRAAWVGLRVAL